MLQNFGTALSREQMKMVKGGLYYDGGQDELEDVGDGSDSPPRCCGKGTNCSSSATRCCGKCVTTNVGEGNYSYTCS